jgi:hypothetical protein
MKNYLYQHWAESTLILAIGILVLLLSFLPTTPTLLFLIWLQFPVYLIHQFEEHVYPGHFKEFINQVVFKSQQIDIPLSTKNVFWINILAIWFLFPLGAVLAQNVSLSYGILLPVFGLFNASLHIILFFVKRRYNPGLIVSSFVNYPTGIYTLYVLSQHHVLTMLNVSLALLATIAAHALIVLIVVSKRR